MVLGAGKISDGGHRAAVCPRIAYMPQGLGKNLYPDLSVRENVEFFGRLFGQSRAERRWRVAELLDSTGLADFEDRPAKKLSGGMRQKLGLCCSLIHDPDLLILDEPTTGVDPLSRRQFWELIDRIRSRRAGAGMPRRHRLYGGSRARFDWLVAMNAASVLTPPASPAELRAGTGTPPPSRTLSLRCCAEQQRSGHLGTADPAATNLRRPSRSSPPVTWACRFGDFTARRPGGFHDRTWRDLRLLSAPTAGGKTTTMKMLTGLLPPTAGEARTVRESRSMPTTRVGALPRRLHVAVVSPLAPS